jgi:hypothetical protein
MQDSHIVPVINDTVVVDKLANDVHVRVAVRRRLEPVVAEVDRLDCVAAVLLDDEDLGGAMVSNVEGGRAGIWG